MKSAKEASVATKTVSAMFRHDGQPQTPSIFQLEEVEHVMVNLAHHFEDLLKMTSILQHADFQEMLASSDTSAGLKTLLVRPRVQLAQKIVKQYWKGRLPLIDDVIYSKMCPTGALDTDAKGFAMGSKTQVKIDKLWEKRAAEPNKFEPASTTPSASTVLGAPSAAKAETHDASTGSKRSLQEALLEEPRPKKQSWPPKLPDIENPLTREQVFTHRSVVKDVSLLSQAEIVARHNERLEFKGDSVLDFVICDMLFARFPTANEGVLTLHKSELVCNDTLSEFAVLYDLPAQLKTQLPQELNVSDNGKKSKLVADIFEAYIGGLTMDRGFDVVQKWLLELYEPLIQDLERSSSTEIDKSAKAELYRKVGSSTQRPIYRVINKSSPFTVECVVNNEVLGKGVDQNTKNAGLRAAMAALKNTKLVEKYANIRRETPRTAPVTGSMAS